MVCGRNLHPSRVGFGHGLCLPNGVGLASSSLVLVRVYVPVYSCPRNLNLVLVSNMNKNSTRRFYHRGAIYSCRHESF